MLNKIKKAFYYYFIDYKKDIEEIHDLAFKARQAVRELTRANRERKDIDADTMNFLEDSNHDFIIELYNDEKECKKRFFSKRKERKKYFKDAIYFVNRDIFTLREGKDSYNCDNVIEGEEAGSFDIYWKGGRGG